MPEKRLREEDRKVTDDSKRRKSGGYRDNDVKEKAPSPRVTREDGHFEVRLGENLTPRFKLLSRLGEGTFAQVVEVWDRSVRERRAMKIVKAIRKYRHAARQEVDLLCKVQKEASRRQQESTSSSSSSSSSTTTTTTTTTTTEYPMRYDSDGEDLRVSHEQRDEKRERRRRKYMGPGKDGVIQLLAYFEYHGHVCMLFPKLGMSVYDFMRRNKYRGFPLEQVRSMARQMVETIAFLHSMHVIHTDLKPENLLLMNSSDYEKDEATSYRTLASSGIKVIDLGSAIFSHQHHSSVITTRHYRPPEVIFKSGWSFPADMYAIGCIITELFTGEAIYQTHDTFEHVAMMHRVCGAVPRYLLREIRDEGIARFLGSSGVPDFPGPKDSQESIDAVDRCKKVDQIFAAVPEELRGEFQDLIRNLLAYDETSRFTAREALAHPFFSKEISAETGAWVLGLGTVSKVCLNGKDGKGDTATAGTKSNPSGSNRNDDNNNDRDNHGSNNNNNNNGHNGHNGNDGGSSNDGSGGGGSGSGGSGSHRGKSGGGNGGNGGGGSSNSNRHDDQSTGRKRKLDPVNDPSSSSTQSTKSVREDRHLVDAVLGKENADAASFKATSKTGEATSAEVLSSAGQRNKGF